MIRIPYRIKEFCILKDIPVGIADKILIHHITPMIEVSEAMKSWVCVHGGGGYLPLNCTCLDGCCGLDGHDFDKYGAVDYTCNPEHFDDLLYYIIKLTQYTRIGVDRKNFFIHCDYQLDNQRVILEKKDNQWVVIAYP